MPISVLLAVFAAASSDPVKIGFGEARPYCYTSAAGRPAGFQIDVFEEAARRAGIQLEWVRTGPPEENNRAMLDARLDVLPMSVPSEERRRRFYVSPPWWKEDSILLIRTDMTDVNPASPRKLAVARLLLPEAATHFAKSERIVAESAAAALEHVCRRSADAALLGATYIRDLVNSRPAVCESVPLQVIDAVATAEFSIVAGRHAQAQAERLHSAVAEMTADGTIAAIAGRHPPISTPHAARLAEELKATYQNQRLWALLFSVCVMLAAGLVILFRQIASHRKLRAIIEQQQRTEQELRDNQAELRQRSADLVRSNEDLQAFAYSVSHDLQEPVRNQALYSELLQRRYGDVLPDEARRFLGIIRNSAIRTQDMMRSVLSYSRAGQTDRFRAEVDCSAMLNAVLQDLALPLEQSRATVQAGPLPVIRGWEERLQQVFHNLIENAIKYRRPDVPPVIRVSAEQADSEWRFTVSDNGIGFRQEYAARIFGLFRRLHGPDRYNGSGIGLALCKRVIERHGGRIWAESREGEGSSFHFTIPLEPQEEEAQLTPQSPAQRQSL